MIALLDANVLYSSRLRDFFMWLALQNAFQAHWTTEIQNEWMRNLLLKRPKILASNLERTQRLMNLALPYALLENVPELDLILPDNGDVHVLSAAIFANANYIVTHNLKDFPNAILEPYGLKATSPDEFVLKVVKQTPDLILNAITMQQNNLQNPKLSNSELLKQLEEQGLGQVIQWVRQQRKFT